jgi:hypothetical protein
MREILRGAGMVCLGVPRGTHWRRGVRSGAVRMATRERGSHATKRRSCNRGDKNWPYRPKGTAGLVDLALGFANNLRVQFGHCVRGKNRFAPFAARSAAGEIPAKPMFRISVQNRDRTICRVSTSADACIPVHLQVLTGPIQQALLQFNNARAAGRT